jgi:surface protein
MKPVYSILLALVSHLALAQNDFITRWDLSKSGSGASQISFGVRTLGPVSYTWTEVSPGTASGSGVFSGSTATFSGLPSGATIDLHISPVNFQRIIINDGPDRLRLVDIKQWGTTTWTSMAMAFWGCNNLEVTATDIPDLSTIGNMESMFRECWVMTGPNNIGEWNMEKSTATFGMFFNAYEFNQPIGNWNTQNVESMGYMFYGARSFNQPIGNWNTQNVRHMNHMFQNATSFNQYIGDWQVQKVDKIFNIFFGATAFNQALPKWTFHPEVLIDFPFVNSGISCYNFSETIKGWAANPAMPDRIRIHGTSPDHSPSAKFAADILINVKGWVLISYTSPSECLGPTSYFTTTWDLSQPGSGASQLSFGVETSGNVDYNWREIAPGNSSGSGTFNGTIATITGLPAGAKIELQISPINFSGITINAGADKDRLTYVRQWGTTGWSSMANAFKGCSNLKVSALDVPDLNLVEDMHSMFSGCTTLGHLENIDEWNTRNVEDMSSLFYGATLFDQSLGNWTLHAGVDLSSIFDDSGLSCYSYSETLKGWAAKPATPDGLSLITDGKTYNTSTEDARNQLESKGWIIDGDSPSGPDCSPPLAGTEFVTRWNLFTTGAGATQLSFGVETSGDVDYTWAEVSPGLATGSGTFNGTTATITGLPANAIIELRVAPTHFQRFKIDNGLDRKRLLEVRQWGSTNWTSMSSAFSGCNNLVISAKDVPNLSGMTDMSLMFSGCTLLNTPLNINSWNTQNITNMSEIFRDASVFNQPIGNWNTGNVTTFFKMFNGASAFNQPIGDWDVRKAMTLREMFYGATSFNQDINNWKIENVTNLNGTFRETRSFNQPLSLWNTSKVTDMSFLFRDANDFNQPIGNWNTGAVINMRGTFQNARAFDRTLGWNTANVTNMSDLFQGTTFNQSINSWNTANVTNMSSMFLNATHFNKPVDGWNTQNVTSMSNMFQGASAFNQSLGSWTLNASVNLESIFKDSGLACANYGETLKGWASNPATPMGRILVVNGKKYNPSVTEARDFLISTKGWSIEGDIAVDNDCNTPLSNTHFVTLWDLSIDGSGPNHISFSVTTSGTVSYTWSEVSPGGATGSGTFSGSTATISDLPTGAIIELRISPSNFQRIRMNASNDNDRLIDVKQWGTTVWITTVDAFAFCTNLQINATDVPNLSIVTNMDGMFKGCLILNGPANIGTWNIRNVQDLSNVFYRAEAFNQPIGNWNTQNVQTMSAMFREARSFNQPIGNWDTRKVYTMQAMFLNADAFNQPLNNWKTDRVEHMSSMFDSALAFNQPLNDWNTENVIGMSGMFSFAANFDQPLDKWNTKNVTSMAGMFRNATSFNQPIGSWNTQNVTSMDNMFVNAVAFNRPVGSWNTQKVTRMNSMFKGAAAFDQSLANWTLNAADGLDSIFVRSGISCYSYSETLKGWATNPSTVHSRRLIADALFYTPEGEFYRNQLITIKGWDITGDEPSGGECEPPLSSDQFITLWDLSTIGSGATLLQFDLPSDALITYHWKEVGPGGAWGVGATSSSNFVLSDLPAGATIELRIWPSNFREINLSMQNDRHRLVDIKQWGTVAWEALVFAGCNNLQISATDLPDLRKLYSLYSAFRECTVLNGPANIGDWDVSNIIDMTGIFAGASAFNQPIGNWNTSNLYFMAQMFAGASSFNQPIGNWDTSNAGYMDEMFAGASSFNQPIGNWNLRYVESAYLMFQNATAFDQPLGNWIFPSYMWTESMFKNSGLSCQNYSETLKQWAANPALPNGFTLDASNLTYSPSAADAHNYLRNIKGWNISGDGKSETECGGPLPVTLVSFSGQKNSENLNVLKWTTIQEKDLDRFEIQRSSDARSFTSIGIVKSKNSHTTTPTLFEYDFADQPSDVSTYYRLKMIDHDLSYAFSRIISIRNEGAQAVVGNFYPNPSTGRGSVDLNLPKSGRWTLTVVDATGKEIDQRTFELQKGKNTLTLDRFTSGLNLIHFENEGLSAVRKLIRE